MPLNEEEQRILAEIERQFHAEHPDSARRFSSTTLQRYLARNCRWAGLGFIVGLVVLFAAFATSWIVGILGFLLMVASAVVLVQNLRRMSRLGIEQMTRTLNNRHLSQTVDDLNRRLRRRFNGDSED